MTRTPLRRAMWLVPPAVALVAILCVIIRIAFAEEHYSINVYAGISSGPTPETLLPPIMPHPFTKIKFPITFTLGAPLQ